MSVPESVSEFLNQQELWVNKTGWLPISEMDFEFRRRAAALLLRRARSFMIWELEELEIREGQNEVQEFMGRVAAPANFMRRTPLYQRLIEGGANPENRAYWDRDDD